MEADATIEPSPTDSASAALRARLAGLALSQSALALQLRELGDDRSPDTILRSIQRMASGEARVSGEMKVILHLLEERQMRLQRRVTSVTWLEHDDGTIAAEVDEFAIYLRPESRGRWSIALRHCGGFSPPWPRWEPSLPQAKLRALLAVEQGHAELEAIATDRAADADLRQPGRRRW